MKPQTGAADLDTTMAQRQAGGNTEAIANFVSTRVSVGTADASFSFGTHAARPSSGLAGDRYFETDRGWLYYYSGTAWAFLAGINYGTNAARAAITVSASDNGATFVTTDTRSLYHVSGGTWTLRLSGIRLDKLGATVAPTVNEDSGDGYEVGSVWIDVTADDAYICVDSTLGVAVWKKTTP